MEAAASKTGNIDYDTTHLGTILTETQLSQGANTWGTQGVGNVEKSISYQELGIQVSVCLCLRALGPKDVFLET